MRCALEGARSWWRIGEIARSGRALFLCLFFIVGNIWSRESRARLAAHGAWRMVACRTCRRTRLVSCQWQRAAARAASELGRFAGRILADFHAAAFQIVARTLARHNQYHDIVGVLRIAK